MSKALTSTQINGFIKIEIIKFQINAKIKIIIY